MTTAVIGTGGIGSAIARLLASGGESCGSRAPTRSRHESWRKDRSSGGVATDNRDALQGADAVVLGASVHRAGGRHRRDRRPGGATSSSWSRATRSASTTRQRRTSPAGAAVIRRGGRRVVASGGALGHGVRSHVGRSPRVLQQPVTGAAVLFYVTDDDRAADEVERLIRTAGFEPVTVGGIDQSSRLEVGGDLHDLVVGPAEARSLIGGA